ncbi:ribosome biogenesis GTPase [Blastococcus colisei]|uniref:Small ribosomal subunit biogenesis GTPase RsgA n=1 Tax=Blastococcus colisei TaxID=1564162 RepID=A0A543PAH3_9ACTN|nr:ribosome biogenesis GTPase [Blastococcus colisei]
MTDLSSLGWGRCDAVQSGTVLGRVARIDRGRLTVLTADGERRVVPGAALHATDGTGPAVGDWVTVRGELAVELLPRKSAFVRTVAGRRSAAQVVAANLDLVLVVDALTGEARMRRIERYLAVAWSSGATPVVVLTKADLCADVAAAVEAVREDALGVDVLPVSSVTGEGLAEVRALLGPGRTAAMVGPSGVGKSSLVNALAGRTVAGTREIRDDGRGRHTTTARELHLLPGGGLLVDTPGMRELALHDDADGVEAAYADVAELAAGCRFRDCGHRGEPGCAVAAAIDDGRLDPARFTAWRKLQAETHRQLLRIDARARAEERARLRSFHRGLRERPNRLR